MGLGVGVGMDFAGLLRIAGLQYGCFSRSQALEIVSKRQLESLISSRVVERQWPMIYTVVGTPSTWHQRSMATALSVTGSALSHRSAARLLGLTFVASERITITSPYERCVKRVGVTVHRSQQLEPFVITQAGIQTTNAARTLVDLSSCLTIKQLGAVVDQACNLKLVTLDELNHCLDQMVTKGRSKISHMRKVLYSRNVNDQDLDSFLERRTLKWMREACLPEPVVQQQLIANGTLYRPDIQYRQQKIAIEPDGPHHLLPSIAAYDRKRDADLQLEGWMIFHVYVEMEPSDIVPRLRQALMRRHSNFENQMMKMKQNDVDERRV